MQGGRQGRSEEEWRVGGREQGEDGREGVRVGPRGRREEATMKGREGAGVDEGRGSKEGGLTKGTSEERTGRCMDGARERGGRKPAEDGGSEEGMEQRSEGDG